MAYWLVKSPFKSRTWARVVAAGQFQLYGIRSAQSRQAIAQMQPGDSVLFYYQQTIWGTMIVTSQATPDPTSSDQHWLAITLVPARMLPSPISLAALRANTAFQNSPLLRQPRLSVMKLSDEQWNCLIESNGLT
ncbi:EVE domain-containing protein [Spirosoma pomorum]